MRRRGSVLITCIAGASLLVIGSRWLSAQQRGGTAPTRVAAVPTEKGGQDIFGAYEVVADWPKDLSTMPGHEGWTFGAGQSVFAESPNRVFVLQRGELPNIKPPATKKLTETAPSLFFPIGRLPWRDATVASPPGNGGTGQPAEGGVQAWERAGNKMGVDARWEHCIMVFDGAGNLVDAWTQYDAMLQRPHFVAISPYDPEKHVWVIDDHKHVIHKYTNDGKKEVQTLGTYGQPGADDKHFNRPTFMAWGPDASIYVADGYNGTRAVKPDKDGKFVTAWGEKGAPGGNETRPGYWNNVHGIAVDHASRRVFVNDRGNHRIQIFDENGKYLSEWSIKVRPSSLHLIQIGADSMLWAFDRNTQKMLKYDLEGHLQYAWGAVGDFPGMLWGVHGMSVDQEGNLYTASVDSGLFQKFVPRPGANPAYLMSKGIYSAWQ